MKKGFSILEILVVLAIVGALAATLIPLMFRNKPTENWTHVLTEFNNVASLAVQASIEQNKVCRLTVEKNSDGGGTFSASIQKVGFPSGEDRLRKGVGAKTHKPVYEALSGTFIKDVFTLSKNISIADVWTPNKESEDGSPGKSCFIMPRGLTQKLIIHLYKPNKDSEDEVSLVMNPFFGQFELVTGFVQFPKNKLPRENKFPREKR